MKQKYGFRIFFTLGIFALTLWTIRPSWMVLSQPLDYDKPIQEQARANYIKENPEIANSSVVLGLDLAGGTHIIVEVDDSGMPATQKADVLDRCLEILRNRVDQFGLSEPIISKSGDRRIVAELAGLNAEEARKLIGATALLEFKLVGEQTDFQPALDRIDNYMKRQLGQSGGSEKDSANAAEGDSLEVTSLFGDVVKKDKKATDKVSDSLSTDSLNTDSAMVGTDSAGSDSEEVAVAEGETTESIKEFRSRPFGSLLVRLPTGGVGVRLQDLTKAKRILNEPDIKALTPKRFHFLWGKETIDVGSGVNARELFFLKRRPEMGGKYIKDAKWNRSPNGVEVLLSFKDRGPKEFSRITGANIKRRLAIVLDSVVYSAPVIQGKITQGSASITGSFSVAEAKLLATTLRAGSLPAPMEIIELRSIGPSLGKDNIQKGLNAALWGLALVLVFMIIYYLAAGGIAIVALLFNLLIIGAVLSMFHATLTLPGIAGIILTIGMAVDANVIIFERIKEELRAKRSVRGSIDAGYKRAFTAIFDSNVTTFGTAFILYQIGTGPIKGFGLTLMIGIAASMFTALYVSRLIFHIWMNRVDIKSLSIGGGLKFLVNPKLNIIPRSKVFTVISLVVILGSFGAVMTVRNFNWGIDFTGGNVYRLTFENQPEVSEIRSRVKAAGIKDPKIQKVGTETEKEIMISVEKSSNDSLTRATIEGALSEGTIIGEESVGPRIGSELKKDAVWAFLLALILIVIYIWIRFGRIGLGFGLGAVLAVFHDVIITWGIFGLFGLEISLTFVAAMLTIVGYSLNDTIVVFDRIRENLEISGKEGIAVKVNKSINQSLARTLITSITTLFVVTVLAIFGGVGIQGFAVAMIIGILVGTYSSICIASPFVVWWSNRSGGGIKVKKKPDRPQ